MPKSRENRIRERAYLIWEDQGQPEDRALDHWLQAEQEVGGGRARPASGDEPFAKRTRAAGSRSAKDGGRSPSGKGRSRRSSPARAG